MEETKFKVGQKIYYGPVWHEHRYSYKKYNECKVISCDKEQICYVREDDRKIPIIEFADIDDYNLLTEEMYEKMEND